MTLLGSLTSRVTRPPKAWTPPAFTQPMLIDRHDLEPIGTERRGRAVYRHPLGELTERTRRLTDREEIPNLPVIQEKVDGEREYRIFDVAQPGSFAAAQAAPSATPRIRVHRPVSLLALTVADRQPESILAPPPSPTASLIVPSVTEARGIVRSGRARIQGGRAFVASARAAGVRVELDTTGQELAIEAPDGRDSRGWVGVLVRQKALVLAELRGDPAPACTSPWHVGKPSPAVEVTYGGALYCAECMAGQSVQPEVRQSA